MSSDPLRADEKTYFAPAGRCGYEQLAEQMRRTLDDECVKVVLEAVDGFVLILNEDRQILAANQELLTALDKHDPTCVIGLRPGEALNCIHFTEGPDGCGTSKHCRACGAVMAILEAQKDGHPAENECRLSFFREGKLAALDLKVRATPLEIRGCKIVAFVLHDISSLKRREVLEQTFLHDFLNLIGGIAGWSELVRRADPATAAREIAALAESLKEDVISQRTLLAAERGELTVKHQPFDAAEVVAKLKLIFEHHPIAEGKALSILAMPERTQLLSDQILLMRVLVNMLKNAFEATGPEGTVQLWFGWRDDAPTFIVQNAGVIPEHVQLRLFERSFSTRSQEGRGIGTYSMKLYGERYLGGKVWFTSETEAGTRFYCSLPPQAPVEGQPVVPVAVALSAAGKGQRILLVDDHEALLRLGHLLLSGLGYEVTACRSGRAALELFRAQPEAYDAVITDWTMPEMSGAELAWRIAEIRPRLPILACTGMGEVDNVNQREGVIRGCIQKPFTEQDLAAALAQVFPESDSHS